MRKMQSVCNGLPCMSNVTAWIVEQISHYNPMNARLSSVTCRKKCYFGQCLINLGVLCIMDVATATLPILQLQNRGRMAYVDQVILLPRRQQIAETQKRWLVLHRMRLRLRILVKQQLQRRRKEWATHRMLGCGLQHKRLKVRHQTFRVPAKTP